MKVCLAFGIPTVRAARKILTDEDVADWSAYFELAGGEYQSPQDQGQAAEPEVQRPRYERTQDRGRALEKKFRQYVGLRQKASKIREQAKT